MKHHPDCAKKISTHPVCVDQDGSTLKDEPVTDQLLTKIADRAAGISRVARGIAGPPEIGSPHSQYQELEFEEEQVGQVLEGEVWKGTFMPHARPDGPRVEMTFSDETGVSITVAAEVPAEIRHLYDHDMLAQDVQSHARRLYDGIKDASRD